MSRDEALFEAVYDAPDDDAPRSALAASLIARGDPRGELITLQLAAARSGKTSKADAARAKALLKEHESAWLAPLRGALVKRTVRWERGFPVAGHLALQKTAQAQDALIGLRPLATVRTLDLELPNVVLREEFLDRFLFETPLRALRALHGMRRALLPRMLVATPPFAIETLEVSIEGGGGPSGELRERELAKELHAAFANGCGLPRLRALQFSFTHPFGTVPETYAWLWETALGRQLETLRMNLSVHSMIEWHRALSQHADRIALRRLAFYGRNDLSLERTENGFTRVTGALSPSLFPMERENVDAALAELANVVHVEVAG